MRKLSENFSAQEAQSRFEAALRGARTVGPKPKKSMTVKRAKPKRPGKRPAKG